MIKQSYIDYIKSKNELEDELKSICSVLLQKMADKIEFEKLWNNIYIDKQYDVTFEISFPNITINIIKLSSKLKTICYDPFLNSYNGILIDNDDNIINIVFENLKKYVYHKSPFVWFVS